MSDVPNRWKPAAPKTAVVQQRRTGPTPASAGPSMANTRPSTAEALYGTPLTPHERGTLARTMVALRSNDHTNARAGLDELGLWPLVRLFRVLQVAAQRYIVLLPMFGYEDLGDTRQIGKLLDALTTALPPAVNPGRERMFDGLAIATADAAEGIANRIKADLPGATTNLALLVAALGSITGTQAPSIASLVADTLFPDPDLEAERAASRTKRR